MGARQLILPVSLRKLSLVVLALWVCALLGHVAPASATATHFCSAGEEAEQCQRPVGVAVNASGDVYVGDQSNNRVDEFEGSGSWLLAWGVGVVAGASGAEMETCTTACVLGTGYGVPEAMANVGGVAVDDDPLSPSYGDVYVQDEEHSRVEKFAPEEVEGHVVMKFVLMFGGEVNANGEDVCRAGETCNPTTTTGTGNGEFSFWPYPWGIDSFIAVGPGGDVYVGDNARVEIFEQSGVWKENISLTSLSSEARPTALAVNEAGDIFLKDGGVAGVHEFAPNGTEMSVEFDQASNTVTSIALDSPGHVFVGDSSGGFHVLEYDSNGKELDSFGRNTVVGENTGLAFSGATGQLYASDKDGDMIWSISPSPTGPVIDSESATPEGRGAATLQAQVDPEGAETTVHFEYVDETKFEQTGYASATNTASQSFAESFEDQSVSAHPTLIPGVSYHYRLVATNANGTTTGEDHTFQEIPVALIDGPWAADVADTSVTLGALIDPLGSNTTYRLEYGRSAAYEYVLSGGVGAGTEYVTITRHIQELTPATTYHFRVVATNEVGTWQTPDHTFVTTAAGSELQLSDGRVWELVTPPNKHGALIEGELQALEGETEAASDGHGITYRVNEPITEHPPASYGSGGDQAISVRGAQGWSTHEVGVVAKLTEEPNTYQEILYGTGNVIMVSDDFSQALVEPSLRDTTPLSPEATERTLYLHNDTTGEYLPLVTPANVPPGTKIGAASDAEDDGLPYQIQQMYFLAATPDLSHIVFRSPRKLTADAIEGTEVCDTSAEWGCPQNLYEWSGGRLELIDTLPSGKALAGTAYDGAYLGRSDTDTMHALSNNGQIIAWSHGELYNGASDELYVRDMAHEKTWHIGGPAARFETMSEDGSMVFYWESHNLYAYDVDTQITAKLSESLGAGEYNGGVEDGFILLASEDGSYVYYVATSVLASGARRGEDNLYVSHFDGSGWKTALVATLSQADDMTEQKSYPRFAFPWDQMAARVSPDGRYLAFMSDRPLTGYDNIDINEEETEENINGHLSRSREHHDEEVFLYDALSGRLVCASCNPRGARPSGAYDYANPNPYERLAGDHNATWQNHWIAADIPGIREVGFVPGDVQLLNQPRYLSNGGRLFFNAADSLVPQDTNGVMDVYEYEPTGVGSCAEDDSTFSSSSYGCVNLISAGISPQESQFLDAGENGEDVFFSTSQKLVPEDYDTNTDIYDAHVCSEAVPCHVASVTPPPCTSGDSCKASPSPQPELFGPTPSETFSGQGNVVPSSQPQPVLKRKAAKCAKGKVRKHGECVKQRQKKRKAKPNSAHRKSTRRSK